MGKDYYSILGVSKDASEDDVKKAYKKAALKWHPDRNAKDPERAKAKFQEVNEAFEVLTDKQKRAIYDQFGEEGLKGGPPPSDGAGGGAGFQGFPGGFGGPGGATFTFTSGGPGGGGGFRPFTPSDPNDIFKSFFSGFGGGGLGGMGMDLDDDDGGLGGIFSQMRGGRGGRSGQFGGGGGGFGRGANMRQPNQTITRQLPVSLVDLFKGVTKKLKVTRKSLSGGTSEKTLQIDVKPGWKAGTKIRFPGEGDEQPDGSKQDIEFVIAEKPDDKFKREGDHLRLKMPLTLAEALSGFRKIIDTLDGRKLAIEDKGQVIRPGQEKRIAGEGMPISKQPGRRGDMIVEYDVRFPRSLTPAQREQINNVLANATY